ncbi:hypothetical protein MYOV003v1_p0087 [Vibrio phage 207E48.1]|nr:hypothetical protein MYOV003v1_p0087 [Vibrio phage 207E48.1]
MLALTIVKGITVNVLSGVLMSVLKKMGKGLDDPMTLAEASLRLQTQAVITRCKRENPTQHNMMFVKFTFPKDISETSIMRLSEEAMQMIMANVSADKFQNIRFGYERRGVIIKMRYKPRGCSWISKE